MTNKTTSTISSDELAAKFPDSTIKRIAAPDGVYERITAAIQRAKTEGRGSIETSEFEFQFIAVTGNTMGEDATVCAIRSYVSNLLMYSESAAWQPKPRDSDENAPNFDCYELVNELFQLHSGRRVD